MNSDAVKGKLILRRNVYFVMVLALLTFLTVGCSNATGQKPTDNGNVREAAGIQETSGAPQASTDSDNESTPAEAVQTLEQSSDSLVENPADNSEGDSRIVAKSSNAVSNKEKEAVIKQLDKELDELFTGIENLEDVEDSDLQ